MNVHAFRYILILNVYINVYIYTHTLNSYSKHAPRHVRACAYTYMYLCMLSIYCHVVLYLEKVGACTVAAPTPAVASVAVASLRCIPKAATYHLSLHDGRSQNVRIVSLAVFAPAFHNILDFRPRLLDSVRFKLPAPYHGSG